MIRLAYAILVGLVGAGIVHIAVLFLVPTMTDQDAWGRIARIAEPYEAVRLDGRAEELGVDITHDPFFRAVACRFDLGEGPVRIHAEGAVPFWSMSVYDRAGQNIFSLNVRTANEGLLDLVILTPPQMLEMRDELPADFARTIFVEARIPSGIAVVRAFVPDDSWEPTVERYLASIACDAH